MKVRPLSRVNGTCPAAVQIAMRMASLLIPVVLLVPLPLAAGEIYRCVEDGRIVYTDQPCEDGEVVREIKPMDAAESVAELERIIARNQEFIERRRDRLAEARMERERAWREQPQVIVVDSHHRPVISPVGHAGFPVKKHRDAPEPAAREERFSALSGPFPGTRRTARDPSPPRQGGELRRVEPRAGTRGSRSGGGN